MQSSEADPTAAYLAVSTRIAAAAKRVGRDPLDVRLTAVSKQQPWGAVAPVLSAGQRVFGENRVQEAMARWGERRAGLELRLIGPLQTNKVRDAVAFFDVIETVDRVKLAERLARERDAVGRTPRLYVQINTGEEPQKAGLSPTQADRFIDLCRHQYGLVIEGLMCIPPIHEPPGPHFALLAKIGRRNGLSRLSMGMSDDFEIAIGHGATDVRVGSALFGARQRAASDAAAS
jgi:pyridoxal phosphate enzyme (YggS family)